MIFLGLTDHGNKQMSSPYSSHHASDYAAFHDAMSYRRISRTLRHLILDNFIHHYGLDPRNKAKLRLAAQHDLSSYCQRILGEERLKQALIHRLMVDTYYISKGLQRAYPERVFKAETARKIQNLWPQLRDLGLGDWPEFSQDEAAALTAKPSSITRFLKEFIKS